MNDNQLRDSEGRFNFKFERVCKCGHTCGVHTAVRAEGQQPCLVARCGCDLFKRARKQPTHEEAVAQMAREHELI